MDDLVLLAVVILFAGMCLGFAIGQDSGAEKTQKEAVAVGVGKYMMTSDKTMKFEWVKAPEKVEKP